MQFEKTETGFRFTRNSRTLLEHSSRAPLFRIGTGVQKVKSKSGFYHMAERDVRLCSLIDFEIESESEDEIAVLFRGGKFSLRTLFRIDGERLEILPEIQSGTPNRLEINIPADRNEQIYGCGEQYTGRNLRGKRVPLWVSEPGVGRRFDLLTIGVAMATKHVPKWFNTYYPSPVWVSSDGKWFKSSSAAYTVLDFRAADCHKAYFWNIPTRLELGLENDTAAALGALSKAVGRQPELPEWAYDGLMLGTQGGSDIVYGKLEKLRNAGVAVSALWCQDWEGRRQTSFGKQLRWAWEYDNKLYPELPAFISRLKEEGVRFLGYNNTFLTPGSTMFDEAVEKEYLVKNPDGSPSMVDVPFDPAALVDFTNPEAREWLKNIIKRNMIGIGMSGWMADFGEMIQHDSILANGETGLDYHNRYAADWAELNREAVKEAGKSDEIIYFMRAGFADSAPSTPLNWNGDQLVDWSRADGLPSAIAASLSLGMSGIGYVHSDIGGYTTLAYKKRSKELLMRWTEYSAFTQVMRSHEGNRPESNVQFGDDDELNLHLARMTKIFCMLKPYHIRLSREYQKSGLPPMRQIILHYPESAGDQRYRYQYLYGEELLVAPVIKAGKTKWKVNIPGGEWVHLWSGRKFSGKQSIQVDAPLGQPPVFFRKGAEMTDLFMDIANI